MGFYTSCFGCPFPANATISTTAAVSTAALPSAAPLSVRTKGTKCFSFQTCKRSATPCWWEDQRGGLVDKSLMKQCLVTSPCRTSFCHPGAPAVPWEFGFSISAFLTALQLCLCQQTACQAGTRVCVSRGSSPLAAQRHRFLLLFCKPVSTSWTYPKKWVWICWIWIHIFQNLFGAFLRQVPKIQTQLNA